MAVPEVSRPQILRRDRYFELQRLPLGQGGGCLLKFPVSDYPSGEEALLEREFELFKELESANGLARPLTLERLGTKLGARYEDESGVPLSRRALPARFDTLLFLDLVRGLCASLASFHACGLLLVGIRPESFLHSAENRRVVLVDAFGARGPHTPPTRVAENWTIDLCLPYAAPEVLGGTPVELDQRADLYALGAILYQLLCGEPPFAEADASAIIQCHLAKEPVPLGERQPDLPEGLARAVMQLLAKRPFDRYPSVGEFERDIARDLAPASKDAPRSTGSGPVLRAPRVTPSERLYGRNAQVSAIRDRVAGARTGGQEIVFIQAGAGMGKTQLMREARAAAQLGAAHFCSGRFSQAEPALPLSGWASALRELASDLLTRSVAELDAWRTKILAELGDFAPAIAVLIPEWEAILHCRRRAEASTQDAAPTRLGMAIHRLLGCFAEADAPVVVFLDDLQWADASSMRILELVLALPGPLNLVVFAAVRTSDDPPHEPEPVRILRDNLTAEGVALEVLTLAPWTRDEVRAFLNDTFHDSLEEIDGFSDLVLAQTRGGPLFVRELIDTLVQRQLLRYDALQRSWRWTASAISTLPVADNVLGILTQRIHGLSDSAKTVLRAAACLGAEFSASELELVCDAPPDVVRRSLELCIGERLLRMRDALAPAVEPASPERAETFYEFAHDRVLEACQALSSLEQREALHLRSADRLARLRLEGSTGEETIYKIAGHFSAARRLVHGSELRFECAEFALKAGQMAKQRGAYSQALEFLRGGLEFLQLLPAAEGQAQDEDAWRERFALSLALHEQTAAAALLDGQPELTHALCDAILRRVKEPLARVPTYDTLISAFKAAKNYPAAIAAGRAILSELGVRLPTNPGVLHAAVGFFTTRRRLLSHPLSSLASLPETDDQTIRARGRIFACVSPAAYLGQPKLFPLLVYRHVNDSLKHGNEEFSAYTYVVFAIMFTAFGDFDRGTRLGNVGLELLKRPSAQHLKARVFSGYYLLIFPWRNHVRDALPYYTEAVESGLQHGDLEFACYHITFHALARLHSGDPLSELVPEFEGHLEKITSLRQERSIIQQRLLTQMVRDLRDGSGGAGPLSGPIYDEKVSLPLCLDPLDENLVFHNHMAKLVLCVFMNDPAAALAAARAGRKHLEGGAFGNYLGAVFTFYESLAYLAAASSSSEAPALQRRVRRNQRKLKNWSDSAPMNFLHKYHLVEAERLAATGNDAEAIRHFESAIALSHSHGFLHETALAQERAARFYFDRGMERLGRHHLREAHHSCTRWGADAKVRLLESEYAQHFALLSAGFDAPDGAGQGRFNETLDYRIVLKACQTISGEIVLPRLLEQLLRIMLRHAGAQRGVLILERDGRLELEAKADVDTGRLEFLNQQPLEGTLLLSEGIVYYAARTEAIVALVDAAQEGQFVRDAYVVREQPKSVLCAPMLCQGKLMGLVYLENTRLSHVFTPARLEVLNLLATQAAISIANARFHTVQLEALQAKINPHFLFNSLSSIADVALSDGRTAETAIVKLAHLYRYILTNASGQLVTVDQEMAVVRNYLSLEKLRFGSKLEFTIDFDDAVAPVTLPGLLIQPLVENSIRHGVAPKMGGGSVSVHASVREGRCSIVVQDDGDGSQPSTSGTGFGLRSVQERLALVYGDDYSFSIERSGGYRVEIEIPAVADRARAV